MSEFSAQSRRAVYRVTYPIPARPQLLIGEETFAVVDCSELGLRYEAPPSHRPAIGSIVHATIVFKRGRELPLAGEVVRLQDTTVALWFDRLGIPFGDIIAEQRYLRAAGFVLGEIE
jgi:hypothetical protein